MDLPEGYVGALCDELAPYGLEFEEVRRDADGYEIDFRADPGWFVQQFPGLGIAESYGQAWPPEGLHLRLRLDFGGDPVQLEFETIDLFAQTASADAALRDRLNTLNDPADHAVAVGQAVALAVAAPQEDDQFYLE